MRLYPKLSEVHVDWIQRRFWWHSVSLLFLLWSRIVPLLYPILIVHYNMPTCWKSVQSKTSKICMASILFIKSVSELREMITELTSSSREPRNVSGINNLLIVPNHLIAILYSLRWPPNIFICSNKYHWHRLTRGDYLDLDMAIINKDSR